jgi:hypothetical protein
MGAPQADGLGNAKASEPHSGLGPTGAIPSAGFTPGRGNLATPLADTKKSTPRTPPSRGQDWRALSSRWRHPLASLTIRKGRPTPA